MKWDYWEQLRNTEMPLFKNVFNFLPISVCACTIQFEFFPMPTFSTLNLDKQSFLKVFWPLKHKSKIIIGRMTTS